MNILEHAISPENRAVLTEEWDSDDSVHIPSALKQQRIATIRDIAKCRSENIVRCDKLSSPMEEVLFCATFDRRLSKSNARSILRAHACMSWQPGGILQWYK
jgi:hypothetical protein